jgi:hypothetical protein
MDQEFTLVQRCSRNNTKVVGSFQDETGAREALYALQMRAQLAEFDRCNQYRAFELSSFGYLNPAYKYYLMRRTGGSLEYDREAMQSFQFVHETNAELHVRWSRTMAAALDWSQKTGATKGNM